MSDIASDTPTVQDESIQAMNTQLLAVVDKNLGFGVLEGAAKQQLQVLPTPPPFCPYARTTTEVKKVDNTATLQGAMELEIITKTMPVAVEVAAQNSVTVQQHAVREESVVVYQYKRIIAKRSMTTPGFRDLLLVKKKTHLERGTDRWLVELYGNQICTTVYYGGEASIALRWHHDANVSTTRIISALQTSVADARCSHELTKTSDLSGFWCRTDVKGFKLPVGVEANSTTMVGVMNLIHVLSKLV